MNFLAPAFLAALGALAVPVIIHLIHRERRTVVPFPSLMFLQRIPHRAIRNALQEHQRREGHHRAAFAMDQMNDHRHSQCAERSQKRRSEKIHRTLLKRWREPKYVNSALSSGLDVSNRPYSTCCSPMRLVSRAM